MCREGGGRTKEAQESYISPLHQTLLGRIIGREASTLLFISSLTTLSDYLDHDNVRPDKGRLGEESQVLPRACLWASRRWVDLSHRHSCRHHCSSALPWVRRAGVDAWPPYREDLRCGSLLVVLFLHSVNHSRCHETQMQTSFCLKGVGTVMHFCMKLKFWP